MKKHIRQRAILDLVENNEIETQEELLNHLIDKGINVTQATVSRDIKELRLIKVLISDGKYKYSTIKNQYKGINQQLIDVLKGSVLSAEKAGNLIVIKTIPNAARLCASAIDNYKIDGVIGTIAGEDTIFVALKQENMLDIAIHEIENLLI